MPDIEFRLYDVLSGRPLGTLDPESYSFNDPIWGAGAFEATVAIPKPSGIEYFKTQTTPDEVQLYIVMDEQVIWGGILVSRPRTPGTQTIKLKGQHWKAWYYNRLFVERLILNADEFTLVYYMMDLATVGVPGTPQIIRGNNLAGKARELTIEPGWSVGKAMDSLGQRDDGFEWTVNFRYNAQTNQPEQFLEIWNPGSPRGNANMLFLDQNSTTNKISIGEITDDATERRSRVWAAGEGTWPDILTVEDHDPAIDSNRVLLREEYITPPGVVLAPTLYDHARLERVRRAAPISMVPIDHPYDSPRLPTYRPGDRVRLRIKDDWEDTDRRGVRIVDRAVNKQKGGIPMATVQLDLLDIQDMRGTVYVPGF